MNTAPNAETHWPICKACFVVIAVVRAVVVLEALGNMCSEALSIVFMMKVSSVFTLVSRI